MGRLRRRQGLTTAPVFVPDEEAARLIDTLLAATDPQVADGVWPGWSAADQAAAVLLPDGRGACLLRMAWPGRPVVARDGGLLAGLVYSPLQEVRPLADLWGMRPPLELGTGHVGSEASALGGRAVVALRPHQPSAADLADAFHRVAFRLWWAQRPGGEEPVEPEPSPEDPVLAAFAAVEGRLLLEAMRAFARASASEPPTFPEVRRLATALALVRRERRAPMADAAVAAERTAEEAFGLAAYVGRRCAHRLGAPLLDDATGDGLDALMRLTPETRFALSGRGLAHLLDKLDAAGGEAGPLADWREELAGGSSLDAALERRVSFDGGARDDAAVATALRRHGYERLVREERARAEETQRARLALVDDILRGPGTLVVCEVAALGAPRVESPRRPEAVNAGVSLYRDGGSFHYPSGASIVVRGTALVHDRHSGLLQLRVRARLAFRADGEGVAPQALAFADGLSLAVAGLRIRAGCGEIRPIDGGYLLRIAR